MAESQCFRVGHQLTAGRGRAFALMMAATRVWLLGLLAVAMWALESFGGARPVTLGVDAPPQQFSAARAERVLTRLLGAEQPHPAGSADNAALHARLGAELARLGVPSDTL